MRLAQEEAARRQSRDEVMWLGFFRLSWEVPVSCHVSVSHFISYLMGLSDSLLVLKLLSSNHPQPLAFAVWPKAGDVDWLQHLSPNERNWFFSGWATLALRASWDRLVFCNLPEPLNCVQLRFLHCVKFTIDNLQWILTEISLCRFSDNMFLKLKGISLT